MKRQQFVIIGGGLAGATAATQLRESGFEGNIHLLAEEPHNPYSRPPLSKDYLAGASDRESIFVQPESWYPEHDIAVTTGQSVTSIGDHTVSLASHREVPFDRLLIATGARARILRVPGHDAGGIFYLRTMEDSEKLHAALSSGDRKVTIIGMGWIGLEIAAAARSYGNSVTVVGPQSTPLEEPLGVELGTIFRELHESHGVTFMSNSSVARLETTDGAVSGVVTSSGTIATDLVVIGIGAIPNTELADGTAIDVDNGILVDEHLATSVTDIFAAGDVANAFHPVLQQRIQSPHWATAIAGGKVAALSMLGQSAVLDDIPYFYTDQFDLGMEYSGYGPLTHDAHLVFRGNREDREFIAFWVVNETVVAGMNVNVWDVNEHVQELIRSRRLVDERLLADPTTSLTDL